MSFHSAVSPTLVPNSFESLPDELLSAILIRCLPPDPDLTRHVESAGQVLRDPPLTGVPVTLSSVCSRWREVACATPQLWSMCWIKFLYPELNTIWLGRSGTLPLRLYGRRYYNEDCSGVDWKALLLSILPFQERWISLKLDLSDPVRVERETTLIEFNVPILEEVRIYEAGKSFYPPWARDLLLSSQGLRDLDIHTLGPMASATAISSWLSQARFPMLVHLTIRETSPQTMTWILLMLPLLQYLYIDFYDDDDVDEQIPSVTHTNLISLQVNGHYIATVLFTNLTLPSLVLLRVMGDWDPDDLLGFIRRSGCRIADLGLSGAFVFIYREEANLQPVLRVLQDTEVQRWVRKLELDSIGLDTMSDVLRLLRYDSVNQYLPHLVHLTMSESNFDHCDGLLADVLMSRHNRPSICDCLYCHLAPSPRIVRFEYARIARLDKYSLDAAMLIPLPEDRKAAAHDADLVLEVMLSSWAQKRNPLPGATRRHYRSKWLKFYL